MSVDCGTGAVDVESAAVVMDVGRSINPAIDIGQVKKLSTVNFVKKYWCNKGTSRKAMCLCKVNC